MQLGSLFQAATRSGYGTGLDEDGHLVEFRGDWRALAVLPDPTGLELVFVELEDWPLLAVDGALRLPLNQAGSA